MNIPELKRRKGQGAFEYILLVAGILLIVVLVIILLKGGLISQSGANVAESGQKANINSETNCLSFCGPGAWKIFNVNSSGNPNCPLTAGLNGTANCFWNGTDTTNCNASYVLQQAGQTNYNDYNRTSPSNTEFCGYVRQTTKETTGG